MTEYRQLKLYEPTLGAQSNNVMERISTILQLIESSIDNENVSGIMLFLRNPRKRFNGDRSKMKSTFSECKVKFPSSEKKEALKFARILKTLKFIYLNLKKQKTVTKRDLYYQDVYIYLNKQRNADDIIDTLAYTLNVSLSSLNLISSQKGLMYLTGCGEITLHFSSGPPMIFKKSLQPQLIPPLSGLESIQISPEINKILVIEKEAIFNTLASEIPGNFLIITGKGYPDRLTQDFLSRITCCKTKSDISVYGIADSDPYGINILLQYLLGYNNQIKIENNSEFAKNECSGCALDILGVSLIDYKSGWLDLTLRDFVFARNLLVRLNTDIERELLRMYTKEKGSMKLEEGLNFPNQESLLNTDLVKKFNENSILYSNKINQVEIKLQNFKTELQRQMFFLKKSEMNVVGQTESFDLNKKNVKIATDYSEITKYVIAKIRNYNKNDDNNNIFDEL